MLYQNSAFYTINFHLIEILTTILFVFFIFLISKTIEKKRIEVFSHYKYFTSAILVKVFASVIFCLVYLFVYGGGDTTSYFHNSVILSNLFGYDNESFFKILFNGNKSEYFSYFNSTTGIPEGYMWRDSVTFFIIRLITPITLITQKSFLITTIIVSIISFTGIWKLYTFFCSLYPKLYHYFAFSILFLPSLLFWGSGILKDTFTLASIGWLTYSTHKVFILKKIKIKYFIMIFISSLLIITIKSYIFIAFLPGMIIWVFFEYLKKIENKLVKVLLLPTFLLMGLGLMMVLFSGLSSKLGDYSDMDAIIKKAQITQEDLTREHSYGKNFYDIGKIDNSISGLLSKMPSAIIAGIFRPFLWEASSLFMLLSGLENLLLLMLLIYGLYKIGLSKYFSTIINTPILTFSILFTILFAYGVGLATGNFGALVRYKIPLLPFFLSALFIQLFIALEEKNSNNNISSNKIKLFKF